MGENACLLPLEKLYEWENKQPDKVFLKQPIHGRSEIYSWARVTDEARRVAQFLRNQDLPPSSHISIISKNCAEWIITDLAIWMSGHVSVPLYPNFLGKTVQKIIEHSEAKFVFIGKLDDWDEIKKGIPNNLPAASFSFEHFENTTSWATIQQENQPIEDKPTRQKDELASIIYTSGTTGEPKGVMHSFESFAFAGTHVLKKTEAEGIPIGPEDRFFSYLPLAHVAERLLTETVSLYAGGEVSFAHSLDTFADNLRECRPTLFLGVPRIWKKFQLGILGKLPQHKLDLFLKIPILSGLIKKKILTGLGLDQVRFALSGAAPISVELIQWFDRIGLTVLEAYGMSENLAYSHVSFPNHIELGSVGEPWPSVETKIVENQEIIIRSPCSMLGYYKNPEQTKQVLRDRFIYTGDQGTIGDRGMLRITGRVKDIFKTEKGKYVAPSPIELNLAKCDQVEQICVLGSGYPQPFGLIVLPDGQSAGEEAEEELRTALEMLNETLDPHERLQKLIVVKDSWTIENNLLTPTLKVKRNEIESKYSGQFDNWIQQKGRVIFE